MRYQNYKANLGKRKLQQIRYSSRGDIKTRRDTQLREYLA